MTSSTTDKMGQQSSAQPLSTNISRTERTKLLEYAHEQEKIIRFFPPGQEKKSSPLYTRAEPNKRLIKCFGVDNAFTTKDIGYKGSFIKQAKEKMQDAIGYQEGFNDNEDWGTLLAAAKEYFQQYLSPRLEANEKPNMARLIQFVTLKISIRYLFNDTACHSALQNPEMNQVYENIGQQINQTWINSKQGPQNQQDYKDNELCTLLQTAIPSPQSEDEEQHPNNPKTNPMNWLLPAYETMWRVVMRAVIEIQYRDAANASNWKKSLQTYLDVIKDPVTPGEKPFHKKKTGIAAIDIIKEALRLYPPSRRIHRQFSKDSEPVKADIEKCHHSKLFGSDPLIFRPERWQEIRTEFDDVVKKQDSEAYEAFNDYCQKKGQKNRDVKRYEQFLGFMPFANVCPSDGGATKGFGMKMIALLVGVVCEGLDGWRVEKGVFEDRETPLLSGREDYGDVVLVNEGVVE